MLDLDEIPELAPELPPEFTSMNGAPGADARSQPFGDVAPKRLLRASPLAEGELLNIPPRQWLYGTMILRRYITVLAASGGTGKTSLAIAIGLALSSNRPLLRDKIHRRCKVWIFNLEDPREELLRLTRAAMLQHGIGYEEIADRLWIDSGREQGLSVARLEGGAAVATPDVDALAEEILRNKVDMLIVDPFVSSHQLPENSNDAIEVAMNAFRRVASQTGAGILLVHHLKKGATQGDADSIRGAGGIVAASRCAMMMSGMTDEEAKTLGVPEAERRFLVRFDTGAKVNLTPKPEKARWLRLESVSLDNPSEDYPFGDHVQAITPWDAPDPFGGLSYQELNDALDRIKAGPAEGGRYLSKAQGGARWVGNLLATRLGKEPEQVKVILAKWLKSGLLYEETYQCPITRKPRLSVVVDDTKRPGMSNDA